MNELMETKQNYKLYREDYKAANFQRYRTLGKLFLI